MKKSTDQAAADIAALAAENERLKRELAAAREEATYAQNEVEYWRRKYHQAIRQPVNVR